MTRRKKGGMKREDGHVMPFDIEQLANAEVRQTPIVDVALVVLTSFILSPSAATHPVDTIHTPYRTRHAKPHQHPTHHPCHVTCSPPMPMPISSELHDEVRQRESKSRRRQLNRVGSGMHKEGCTRSGGG